MARLNNLRDFESQVKWFDIKNYACINDLSENEILIQVEIRVHWLFFLEDSKRMIGESGENSSTALFISGYKDMFDADWELITKGQVIIEDQFKQTNSDDHFSDDLPALEKAKQEDLDNRDNLPFTFNTREFTDSEILAQVKKYLANSRRKDNFITPKRVKFTGVEKTKLKTHKPVPVLDLMIWQLLNDKTITQSLFERAVFLTDCIDYKQGVLPFIKKLRTLNRRTTPIL